MKNNSKKNNQNHSNVNNNTFAKSQNQNNINLELEGDDDMPKILLATDAGNGIFKLAYKTVSKVSDINEQNITLMDFPAMVEAEITSNEDTDTIIINGVKCKINSGIKVGQRKDTIKKTNKHTIANIHYAMYQVAKETNVRKFDLAIGVTQDIHDNELFRNIYKAKILNIDERKATKLKDGEPFKEPFKITIQEPGQKEITLEILSLCIRPEAVSGLSVELNNVRNNIVKNKLNINDSQLKNIDKKQAKEIINGTKLWVIDLGTLTSHYTVYENQRAKLKAVNNDGYVTLVNGFGDYLQVTEQLENEFDNVDKIIRQRRKEEKLKYYVENIYLKQIEEDLTSHGADLEYDHLLFIGGTTDELKDYISEVFNKNTTISKDGFHANVLGMFKRLVYEVNLMREQEKEKRRIEKEKQRIKEEKEREKQLKQEQEALQEVAMTKTEDNK